MTKSQEQILRDKINNRAIRRTYHKGSRPPDPLPASAKRQMQHKPYARDWSDADADEGGRVMVWRLPVKDDLIRGTGFKIRNNAKIHCFENSMSLCGKHYEVTECFDEADYGEEDIDVYPEHFCKACVKKYKRLKNR